MDEECITVYLRGDQPAEIRAEDDLRLCKNHLLDWLSKLPSYQAFSDRVKRLVPAFHTLAEYWLGMIGVDLAERLDYIVDSCPIILAKGPRSGHARAASLFRCP